MKLQHPAFAKAAMAVTLTATLLTPGTALSQSKPGANATDRAIHPQVNGPEEDPNMPALPYAFPGAPIRWTSSGAGQTPVVFFIKPSSSAAYLGFNEKGSWIRNENDRRVYVWNLNERSLTLGAEREAGVPLDLRNPSNVMKNIIANATGHGSSGITPTNNNGRRTPYIPPSVAGDGNARHTGEGPPVGISDPNATSSNPAGVSRPFKGTGATIKEGVLTFSLDDPASPDNGKPISVRVTRAAMNNPNTAKPNGIAGAWIGEDWKNKDGVVSLYLQGENGAVSGTAMTGFAAEALKRIMTASQQ